MSFPKYNNNYYPQNSKDPKGKKAPGQFMVPASDYQKFLEYLEKTGPSQILRRKLMGKKGEQND